LVIPVSTTQGEFKMTTQRKSTIRETLNKHKVKAMKLLIDAMQGGTYRQSQISASTNILMVLQQENGE